MNADFELLLRVWLLNCTRLQNKYLLIPTQESHTSVSGVVNIQQIQLKLS